MGFNLGEGLAGLGRWAGEMGLQQMKVDAERQQTILASSLAQGRQEAQNKATGVEYETGLKKLNLEQEQAFTKSLATDFGASPEAGAAGAVGAAGADTSAAPRSGGGTGTGTGAGLINTNTDPNKPTDTSVAGTTGVAPKIGGDPLARFLPDGSPAGQVQALRIAGQTGGRKAFSEFINKAWEPFTLRPGTGRFVGNQRVAYMVDPDKLMNPDGTINENYLNATVQKAKKEAEGRVQAETSDAAAAGRAKVAGAEAGARIGPAIQEHATNRQFDIEHPLPPTPTSLSPDAINDGAAAYIAGLPMPQGMRDRSSMAAVLNRVAELRPKDVSSTVWAEALKNNVMAYKARQQTASAVGKQQALTTVNEDTVNGAVGILNGLLKQGAGSNLRFVDANAALQWMREKTNDPLAVNLKNAIGAISNEYARVMTGTTGGTAASDSARNEAASRLLLGYSGKTMDAVTKQMQQEMKNRSDAYINAMQQLTGGAYGGVAPSLNPGQTTGQTGQTTQTGQTQQQQQTQKLPQPGDIEDGHQYIGPANGDRGDPKNWKVAP